MVELIPQLKLKLSKRILACLSKGYLPSMRPQPRPLKEGGGHMVELNL